MKKAIGIVFTALGMCGFALDTALLVANNAEAAHSGVSPEGGMIFGVMVAAVILSMIGFTFLYSEGLSFAWFIGIGVTFILSGMVYAASNLVIAQQNFVELPTNIIVITSVILFLGVVCLIYGIRNIGNK